MFTSKKYTLPPGTCSGTLELVLPHVLTLLTCSHATTATN